MSRAEVPASRPWDPWGSATLEAEASGRGRSPLPGTREARCFLLLPHTWPRHPRPPPPAPEAGVSDAGEGRRWRPAGRVPPGAGGDDGGQREGETGQEGSSTRRGRTLRTVRRALACRARQRGGAGAPGARRPPGLGSSPFRPSLSLVRTGRCPVPTARPPQLCSPGAREGCWETRVSQRLAETEMPRDAETETKGKASVKSAH